MTIKELFNELQEANKDLTLELYSPYLYEINYCGNEFAEIDLIEKTFNFGTVNFGFYEAAIIIGVVKAIKEFIENYDD